MEAASRNRFIGQLFGGMITVNLGTRTKFGFGFGVTGFPIGVMLCVCILALHHPQSALAAAGLLPISRTIEHVTFTVPKRG